MRLRTAAIWALFGMVVTGTGAMALPIPQASRGSSGIRGEPTSDGTAVGSDDRDPAHFSGGQTLALDARLGHASIARGRDGETYLFASVTGADAPAAAPPPLNLAVVVDRSGSMMGVRIANAIAAASAAVERMRDEDSVTVVSFDTQAKVVVAPTRTTAEAKPAILAAIRNIRLGGDTCISCGLDEAMHQLEQTSVSPDQVNRMILLSDGEPTDGVKDVPGFRTLAAGMRDRGFPITTIGVDVHYEEKVMEAIALESNGHHYFVANPSGLPAIFQQEFELLEDSVANESELSVELAPGVEVEEVYDRGFRREGTLVVVPFGAFAAKQEKTVLMKLRVPGDRTGEEDVAKVRLRYRDLLQHTDADTDGQLALDVKSDGSEQRALDPFVAARVERAKTASTLRKANDLFEKGKLDEARAALDKQQHDLAKAEATATAAAATAAPKARGRGVTDDFESQRADIATAQKNLAPTALPPSPSPQFSPQGQAAVRANEANDFRNGF